MSRQVVQARRLAVLFAIVLLCGCSTTRASGIATGAKQYAAAPPSKVIETYFTGQTPSRPYEEVGVVKGRYAARTAWGSADLSDLLPELHAKARELGADAIIVVDVNRYLGPALNPMLRTIPNVEATASAVRYVPGEVQSADPRSRQVAVTPPPAEATSLNGTFAGEIVGNARGHGFKMRVTFTIVQTGDQIAGAWTTTGGTSGTVKGSITETGLLIQARQLNPCIGEFVGIVSIESGAARLRGSYTGRDCEGEVTASFLVDRQ